MYSHIPTPKISVIIPMYNVEKYIEDCLNSIITQTFQDFEVILVDDCSTDRSVEIAERFIASNKTGNLYKIHLHKMPGNSGNAAMPRNMGLRLATGKYVTFVDGDDMIVQNAFEILFNIAEQFNADVVHTEKYFGYIGDIVQNNDQPTVSVNTLQSEPFVNAPTLETNDLAARVMRFCQRGYMWGAWGKIYRRTFLIENRLEFLDIYSEDMLFVALCVCLSKRFVRIPDITYVYRFNPNSQTNTHTLEKDMRKMVTPFVGIINSWENHFSKIEFFNEHPEYRFMLINFFLQIIIWFEGRVYEQLPPHMIEQAVHKYLALIDKQNDTKAMTHLFNSAAINYRYNLQLQQKIAQLESRLQKLKFMSKELLLELQK